MPLPPILMLEEGTLLTKHLVTERVSASLRHRTWHIVCKPGGTKQESYLVQEHLVGVIKLTREGLRN